MTDDILGGPAPALLVVDDLHVGYDTSHVLEGVSLTIAEGESLALLGRNGMGKTTLVRALTGLAPPTVSSGTILFDGASLRGLPPHRIAAAGIGLVPQGRHVFGSLTVRENLRIIPARQPRDGDEPWTIEMCREDFVSEALAGRMFHRAAPGQLPPLNCAEHEPAGAAR